MSQVVAMIPAHNEEAGIAAAIHGLQNQTSRPDRIVVVTDNCTDGTARIALEEGAEVFATVGNTDKKAGALNQFLEVLLLELEDDDLVLVQDADSALDPDFLAIARLEVGIKRIGAVGGVFRGTPGGGVVGHLQRNEYARYARDVRRLNGKCLVVTGTAAVLRAGCSADQPGPARRQPPLGRRPRRHLRHHRPDRGQRAHLRHQAPRLRRAEPRRLHPRHRGHAHVEGALGTSACAGSAAPSRTACSTASPA